MAAAAAAAAARRDIAAARRDVDALGPVASYAAGTGNTAAMAPQPSTVGGGVDPYWATGRSAGAVRRLGTLSVPGLFVCSVIVLVISIDYVEARQDLGLTVFVLAVAAASVGTAAAAAAVLVCSGEPGRRGWVVLLYLMALGGAWFVAAVFMLVEGAACEIDCLWWCYDYVDAEAEDELACGLAWGAAAAAAAACAFTGGVVLLVASFKRQPGPAVVAVRAGLPAPSTVVGTPAVAAEGEAPAVGLPVAPPHGREGLLDADLERALAASAAEAEGRAP